MIKGGYIGNSNRCTDTWPNPQCSLPMLDAPDNSLLFTILKLCLLSLRMMLSTCIISPAILTQLRHSSISLLLTALHPIPSPCFSL